MTTNLPIDYFVRGRRVRYVPGHAVGPYDMTNCEDGTVLRAHNDTVFVKFDPKVQRLGWNGATAEACTPTDLWSDGRIVDDPEQHFAYERIESAVLADLLKSDKHQPATCIHCGFPSKFISSGLCHECIRLKLIAVERLIMDAPCQLVRSYIDCNCVSCCTKMALVALTNQFANPKEKTATL